MRDPFVIDGPTCLSFSGGRTSGLMLRRTLDANTPEAIRDWLLVCFANTGREDEATLRFPTTPAALEGRARDLMHKLLEGTHQHSALMVSGPNTEWVTKRATDGVAGGHGETVSRQSPTEGKEP